MGSASVAAAAAAAVERCTVNIHNILMSVGSPIDSNVMAAVAVLVRSTASTAAVVAFWQCNMCTYLLLLFRVPFIFQEIRQPLLSAM